MVAGVVPQWGRIAKSVFDLGRDSNSDGNRSAQSSANCGMAPNVAPLVCSIQRPSTSRVPWRRTQPTTSARAGAYAIRALRRSPRPNLLVVQMIGRLANRCAVEDRPSGWRDPGRYRDGPCRHATTIETFRAGPNMNRRIAIVGESLSDGGTVNAHVGAPLPVVSISGTKTRSRLRSCPPGSDEDWFPDLSNSKEILFRDMK